MPISPQPFEAAGLAALAGKREPFLNLKDVGLNVGAPDEGIARGILLKTQLDTEHQRMMNELTKTIYEQQQNNRRNLLDNAVKMSDAQSRDATTKRGQDMTNQLGYDRLGNESYQKQQELGLTGQRDAVDAWYKQQGISQKDQELHQQAVAEAFKEKMAQSKEDLAKTSQIFGGYMYATSQNKDPEFLKYAQKAALDQAHNAGLISDDEYNKAKDVDPTHFGLYAAMQSQIGGKAMVAKQMGMQIQTNPDGTVTMSQGLDQKSQNDNQAMMAGSQRSMMDIAPIVKNFNPDLFTTAGNIQATAGQMASRVYGPAGQMIDPQNLQSQRANFSSNILQSLMDTLQQQKGVRFNRMSLDALSPEIPHTESYKGSNGETIEADSPETAFNKIITLYQRMNRAASFGSQLAQKGIDLNSSQYDKQMADYIKSDTSSGNGQPKFTTKDGKTSVPIGYREISQYANDRGMDFSTALNDLANHGTLNFN